MTETGSIMGTAQYLSPEQAQGHAVSPQSDLYAIGIVLYEMLTGRVPFDGESAVTIALKQVSRGPAAALGLEPGGAARARRDRAARAREGPGGRFTSADEFIAALQAAADRIASGAALGPGTVAFGAVGSGIAPPLADGTGYVPPQDGQPGDPEDGRRPKRWPWIVASIALLCIAGGLIWSRPTAASTPARPGDRAQGGRAQATTAQTVLSRAGFRADIQRFVNSAPPDQVFGQDPGAGVKADKGAIVTVRVSEGPAQKVVPDVNDDSEKDAKKALKQEGFKVKTTKQFSETVPDGSVIRTIPGAGEKADAGSEVTLVVSKGTQPVAVPNVVGQSRDSATSTLQNQGFAVDVTEQESDRHHRRQRDQPEPDLGDVGGQGLDRDHHRGQGAAAGRRARRDRAAPRSARPRSCARPGSRSPSTSSRCRTRPRTGPWSPRTRAPAKPPRARR